MFKVLISNFIVSPVVGGMLGILLLILIALSYQKISFFFYSVLKRVGIGKRNRVRKSPIAVAEKSFCFSSLASFLIIGITFLVELYFHPISMIKPAVVGYLIMGVGIFTNFLYFHFLSFFLIKNSY